MPPFKTSITVPPVSIANNAIIDSSVSLGDNVTIGPFSIIGPGVSLGAGTEIGPHLVLESGACLRVFALGTTPSFANTSPFTGQAMQTVSPWWVRTVC